MAAWGYEFYLLVLTVMSERSEPVTDTSETNFENETLT